MRGLAGKVVVIAGGGSGIGAVTARRLAQEGASVMIGDLAGDAAIRIAHEITASGGSAIGQAFDVTDSASVEALMAAAVTAYGRLDAVHVNAADMRAIHNDGDALDVEFEIFDKTIAVNLRGHLVCTRHALPYLLRSGGGSLIYTTSEAAYAGQPTRVSYGMSKSGLNALMRHVASRWGREGVRANAVAPGFTLTPEIDAQLPEDMREAFFRQVKVPRLVAPEDIAAAVAFLISDDAVMINGQVLSIDGGATMRA